MARTQHLVNPSEPMTGWLYAGTKAAHGAKRHVLLSKNRFPLDRMRLWMEWLNANGVRFINA